jgi:hypothetical protein
LAAAQEQFWRQEHLRVYGVRRNRE